MDSRNSAGLDFAVDLDFDEILTNPILDIAPALECPINAGDSRSDYCRVDYVDWIISWSFAHSGLI